MIRNTSIICMVGKSACATVVADSHKSEEQVRTIIIQMC